MFFQPLGEFGKPLSLSSNQVWVISHKVKVMPNDKVVVFTFLAVFRFQIAFYIINARTISCRKATGGRSHSIFPSPLSSLAVTDGDAPVQETCSFAGPSNDTFFEGMSHSILPSPLSSLAVTDGDAPVQETCGLAGPSYDTFFLLMESIVSDISGSEARFF